MGVIKRMRKAYELRHCEYLTLELISEYMNELYKEYTKVFKSHEEYLKYREALPNYSFSNKRNGAGETGRNEKGIIYVIPHPRENERDKIEAFLILEDKRNKLIDVRNLQYKMYEKEIDVKGLQVFNEIKGKIDLLFKDVLNITENEEETEGYFKYDYLKIGVLFAQGLIRVDSGKFYFKDEVFDNRVDLDKALMKELKMKSIRQYTQDTLFDVNESRNNLCQNKTKMIEIMKYCKENHINVNAEFQSKYDDLE